MSEPLIGQLIGGKYRVIKHLGRGGMAEVYLARQESLERDVAIKLMHAFLLTEQDFLHRFKREAKAMAAMRHPNIVAVYDFDVYGDNTYYLVMEYINGGTLKERLAELADQGERLPLEQTLRIGIEVADALEYAHHHGIVHRDVKPANIMLNERGRAILTDFGIVKLVGGQSVAYTVTGALIGTPAYMSPEQALGQPGDARSDIYSLGVLLFQMVTGILPFDGDTPLAIVLKHVNEVAPLPISFNPNVPLKLQDIILKALSKNPEERFQSAGEMGNALRSLDLTGTVAGYTSPATLTTPGPTMTTTQTVTGIADRLAELAMPETATAGSAISVTPAPATRKWRSAWVYIIIGTVFSLLLAGIIYGQFSPETNATATTAAPGIVAPDTSTPEATIIETALTTPVENTPDVVASAVAAIEQTQEAVPTATPTPSYTPSPTPEPTADQTAVFLQTCTNDARLALTYVGQNRGSTSVPVESTFTVNWVLQNNGGCPWPDDLRWGYQSGDEFGYPGEPIPLNTAVDAGQSITLTARFVAPDTPDTYNSSWQLVNGDDEPFGPALTFAIQVFVPTTPTPAPPTPTLTPAVSPTPMVQVSELNYLAQIQNCSYIDSDWECRVRLTPFGGAGGPYTLFVFDQPAGQATVFRGSGPHDYFARGRRCFNFVTDIRLVDDGQTPSLEMSRGLFIDPNVAFPDGCTLP